MNAKPCVDKSIVFVTPTLRGGGAERVAVELSRYFASKGYDFTFLLTKSADFAYELPEGVGVIVPSADGKTGPAQQVKAIRQMMTEDPSRTFISFLASQNLLTLIAGLLLSNRVFVSVRNVPEFDFDGNRMVQRIRNLLYRGAAGVVFQTREQMNRFPAAVVRNGKVIPNPLSASLPQPWEGPRRSVIATSGRLVPQKNHFMTIEAFSTFLVSHPGFRLEIYGEGPLKRELQDFASSLGVCEQIDFFGFRSDAMKLIRSASAYVMSSDFEGLSNSMIEALAMGVPTVCTRCDGGGAAETIEDGVNGLLVEKRDVASLSAAMSRLVDDQEGAAGLSERATLLRESMGLASIGGMWENYLFGGRG